MPAGFKTFGWIARQLPSIRFLEDGKFKSDDRLESKDFMEEFPDLKEKGEEKFEKGKLWPCLVLIERHWEGSEQISNVFARVFKRRIELIVDFWVGDNMDDAVENSLKYKIPIWTISTSRKGKRSSAQKIRVGGFY